ncbi:hypothetical protein [Psychrobacillus soli]|uniref:Uncharacterized protein n=1 Tax=Psychrobacillus soli TaxID=1543965 RepID=A0A544TB81_9BACI|nr:hypothetical protein [Psychrobacillus soli]TQR14715.1 hypothetical protein FG383_10320 [Psychrobacillus soli]
MNNLLAFNELHQYLMSFQVRCTIAEKNLIIGYKPFSFVGIQPKIATLHGSKNYQCLILHVAPGDKKTDLGKQLQREIQGQLAFDITELRKFKLKNNEVFVPLEVVDTKEKMKVLKEFIQQCFEQRKK